MKLLNMLSLDRCDPPTRLGAKRVHHCGYLLQAEPLKEVAPGVMLDPDSGRMHTERTDPITLAAEEEDHLWRALDDVAAKILNKEFNREGTRTGRIPSRSLGQVLGKRIANYGESVPIELIQDGLVGLPEGAHWGMQDPVNRRCTVLLPYRRPLGEAP